QDGRNFNFVSVLDIELLKRFGRSALVVVFWEIDPKHGAVLVRLYAINIDVTQCPRGKHAACEFQHLREALLASKLVNSRAPHHAFHGDLLSDWVHQKRVAGLQPLHSSLPTM